MKTLLLALMLLSTPAAAEQVRAAGAAAPAPSPAPAPSKPKGTRPSRPVSASAGTMENGVLKFDAMTIEGRIEKPIPIHARERTTPVFQDLLPEESFLGEILDASEEEPF